MHLLFQHVCLVLLPGLFITQLEELNGELLPQTIDTHGNRVRKNGLQYWLLKDLYLRLTTGMIIPILQAGKWNA